MTGLTGDRRSRGATSEERGERKHVVRRHELPTVPGLRNLKKTEEQQMVSEKDKKQTNSRVTGSNKGAVGPKKNEARSPYMGIRGLGSTVAD